MFRNSGFRASGCFSGSAETAIIQINACTPKIHMEVQKGLGFRRLVARAQDVGFRGRGFRGLGLRARFRVRP